MLALVAVDSRADPHGAREWVPAGGCSAADGREAVLREAAEWTNGRCIADTASWQTWVVGGKASHPLAVPLSTNTANSSRIYLSTLWSQMSVGPRETSLS